MAQTGYTPIQLYYSTTAAAVPTAGNLANGELAINITDGKLYYKNNGGVVTLLAGSSAGPAGGSNTQVQYNSSGVLAGSANMTFDGTTLTLGANPILSGGTANGVAYLNGSKAVTSGSALTFSGIELLNSQNSNQGTYIVNRNVSTGTAATAYFNSDATASFTAYTSFGSRSSGYTTSGMLEASSGGMFSLGMTNGLNIMTLDGYPVKFGIANAEQMRLNSTGLGIGTSSPSTKLHAKGSGGTIATFERDASGTIAYFNRNAGSGNAGAIIGADSVAGYFAGGNSTSNMVYLDSVNNLAQFYTNATERLRIAANGAWGLSGANYGTSGQVLTSNGSGSAPTWQNAGGGGSAATPTVLGTVYGKQTTSGASPYLTAYGYIAGTNTTGVNNSAFGYSALNTNSTGTDNSAFGIYALNLNSSGSYNTAYGSYALGSNTTASSNTGVGYYAVGSNTTGASNTGVGREALSANSTGASNTALGFQALKANTTASENTAVGVQALYNNTTGAGNVAIGGYAGYYNTTGNYNVFVGQRSTYVNSGAGQANTTGVMNVAVGGASLAANTTGGQNTALGSQALASNSTASNNTAVGYSAMESNTTGSENVAVGREALKANTTGPGNTAVGYQSLYNNTNGSTNIGIGYQAGYGLRTSGTSPGQNIAIGNETLYSASYSSYHIAIGYQALRAAGDAGGSSIAIGQQAGRLCATPASSIFIGNAAAYTATYWIGGTCVGTNAGFSYNDPGTPYPGNTFVGDGAGYKVSTGTGNTFVGGGGSGYSNGPGYNTTTGYQNTGMGTGALSANATGGNSTGIGYVAFSNQTGGENTGLGSYAGVYNFGSGAATVGGNRNVFLGAYTIASGASDSNCIIIGAATVGKGSNTGFINPNSGGVYQGNNSSSWSTTSDQRLKKNIVDNTVGLSAINSIRVRNFEYRLEDEITELSKDCAIKKEGVQLGVIAQELQAVLPDCVKQETTGVLSVDPDNLTWYMVNAIKELNAKIEAQAAEIAILKGQA